METTVKLPLTKTILTIGLLMLLVAGVVIIAAVFLANRQSLPVDVSRLEILGRGETMTLPVVSTDNAPSVPGGVFSGDEDDTQERITGTVQIPDPSASMTILLAGVPGCSTCGIEAQHLSRLVDEYGTDRLQVVFVDVYHFGSASQLAWFANVLEATNLTWAIDTDGAFKQSYNVDIDATVMMNGQGDILYRDDIMTSYETLRDQIQIALRF